MKSTETLIRKKCMLKLMTTSPNDENSFRSYVFVANKFRQKSSSCFIAERTLKRLSCSVVSGLSLATIL